MSLSIITILNEENLAIYVDRPIEIENESYFAKYEFLDNVMVVQEDPISYIETINSSQKDQFLEAMQAKYDYLISKGTWILIYRPLYCVPIKCK